MRSGERIPALDGLRALAALLVVAGHIDKEGFAVTAPLFVGTQGVFLFFTLSGFLMAHLYLWKPCDRGALTHFAVARVGRIVPLFALVVIASGAIPLWKADFVLALSPLEVGKHLILLGSKHVFWTIPPEIEFYIFFAVIWLVTSRTAPSQWVLPLTALLAFLFVARPIFPGITAMSHIHIFMAGVAAGLVRRRIGAANLPQTSTVLIQFLALATLVVTTTVWPTGTILRRIGWDYDGVTYGHLPLAFAYGVAVLAMSVETPLTRLVFANPAMRAIGAWSFSLYLLHEPVMSAVHDALRSLPIPMAVTYVIGLTCAILIAAVSFTLIERPGQHLVRHLWFRAKKGPHFSLRQPLRPINQAD